MSSPTLLCESEALLSRLAAVITEAPAGSVSSSTLADAESAKALANRIRENQVSESLGGTSGVARITLEARDGKVATWTHDSGSQRWVTQKDGEEPQAQVASVMIDAIAAQVGGLDASDAPMMILRRMAIGTDLDDLRAAEGSAVRMFEVLNEDPEEGLEQD